MTQERWIRCGSCSVCRCALESPDGKPSADARPRSRKLRRIGHRHSRPWGVVSDGDDGEVRDWHDLTRGRRAPVMHADPDGLPSSLSRALRGW